jgi:uncharacterized protein with von Willebrand factor type A (vWA) domain
VAYNPAVVKPQKSQLLRNLVIFGRLLRRLGIEVTLKQILALVDALEHLDIARRRDVKDGARAVLVNHREQLEVFDRAFDLFWSAGALKPRRKIDLGRLLRRIVDRQRRLLALSGEGAGGPEEDELEAEIIERRGTYSSSEVLRRKDFAALTAEEARMVEQLMRRRPWAVEPRRTRRRVAAPSGPYPDMRRTMRRSLKTGGHVFELAWQERRRRPRPLVVLCDISGSMEAYARIFLQFIYTLRAATDRLEAFVFATRLTRISRQLRRRNVDQALQEAVSSVVDWGGGTRIGESFKRFNYVWARRVLGRGSVVAILSDAWDRGDVDLLERETARLRRSCDRLLWLNPLLGSPGYQPLTRGIRRVLPLIDDFLPVHNLESLEQLGRALAKMSRASARRAAVRRPAIRRPG